MLIKGETNDKMAKEGAQQASCLIHGWKSYHLLSELHQSTPRPLLL